ncbi:disease resistance protein RUN1-like [Gossypium arboreum]|uniref:disease resistance protein RUN1-like n=1 Tax=Gossypium arboreum TaxID=29729 RepID=UPI0022F15F07|nr:disease resistance protein RUN1-like [Gossypium arboreum]
MNVFFDEETLEKGEQLSQALSRAIAASNLSIIVLSVDYASSKSCLAELSDIMRRKDTQGHIVLPIFYHVDPSMCGILVTQTEYIKDIVGYVIKKLMSGKFKSASAELLGIDDQKQTILRLIEQEESHLIGLWGQGGIGKTTLSDVIYNEISHNFENTCFLLNVREKLKKQGMESLRNQLLSELLNQAIHVDTPSIGSTLIQERLNNKRVLVVLDDVNDSDQIDCFGVKHFGDGSKIIVTSRDRQVLKNGGVDKIHEVKKLNDNDSLQLFSTFAFKQLNPAADFRDLSNKFVGYAQGSPLALRVLGSKLYKKSRKEWESEVDRLKEYDQPKISQILRSSFDELDEVEKNIFLDIAIFFKGTPKKDVEEILSCCYKGAVCGISNLIDKCLLDNTSYNGWICMHDMLEEMGKDIVRKESIDPGKCSRLWSAKDVYQVLKYNKGINLIQGIKLDMSQIDNLQLHHSIFEGMINLRIIFFYTPGIFWGKCPAVKLLKDQVDSVSLPDELRYLCWDYYPFKYLSGFNPKNLVVLKLAHGHIERLWNDDDHQVYSFVLSSSKSLVNLREIDFAGCKKLRKIPSLLGAINLEILECRWCESLVELPCINNLASLKKLGLTGCNNLKTFPEVPKHFSILELDRTKIEEVPASIEHLVGLRKLCLKNSNVNIVSSNISKLESLRDMDLSHCPMVEFPEIPRSLTDLNLSETQIEEVCLSLATPSNLQSLNMSGSRDKIVSIKMESLRDLNLSHCPIVKFPEIPRSLAKLNLSGTQIEEVYLSLDSLFNLQTLNQDSIDNIEANAILKIGYLAEKLRLTWEDAFGPIILFCCFPGNKISANKFEYQSMSSLFLKIAPNESSGSRFLVFSICLVVDLMRCHHHESLKFICKYQLTTASGGGNEKFTSEWSSVIEDEAEWKYMGDHVLILFREDMVKKDKDYEEASFEFYIENPKYNVEGEEIEEEYIKVEKCGVHVSYMDEEPSTTPQHKSPRHTSINQEPQHERRLRKCGERWGSHLRIDSSRFDEYREDR